MLKNTIILCCLMLLLNGCVKPKEEVVEAPFVERITNTYSLAERWFRNNMREKGLFRYIYDVDKDEYPNKNNAIRQLMASRLLAELSQEDDSLQSLHRKNIDFIFTNWYQEEEKNGYIYYNNKSKLGANAMALRTLCSSPLFYEYEDQAENLYLGILSLMNDNGSLRPWFKEPTYEYDADRLLTFYSGEAIVALLEYYKRTEDEEILNAAKLAQGFYIDRYVTHLDENYYPAYVPWHTISLSKLYKITGERKYVDAIFALNDKLLEILDTQEYIGRFYNPQFPQYGKPHSASDGVYTEGLAYAYEIALMVGDEEHEQKYKQALELVVENISRLQYKELDALVSSSVYPERLIGGIRSSVANEDIRIDNVQHAMDAFRKIMEIQTTYSPERPETVYCERCYLETVY